MKTVVGLFDHFDDAQNAVRDLRSAGFAGEDISMIARDEGGQYSKYLESGEKQNVGDGAAAGAGIGAVLGGLGGLLIGLGALAIPGIGPVIAAGPIITTLGGAGVGAIAGGIVGALVDLGIPEEHANMYAEGIRRGGTLVVARTSDEMADQAADVMNRYHPVDIDTRAGEWRQQNWNRFDENAPEYSNTQNQASNIPVTGDQTGPGMGMTGAGTMGTTQDWSNQPSSTGGQPDQGYHREQEFNRGSNFDAGSGSYGSDRDYNTSTGGVGDRGMSSGSTNQESTASDYQHDRLNDQGQVGMGGTAGDYSQGSGYSRPSGGTQEMGGHDMGPNNMGGTQDRGTQNTGVNQNDEMGDDMDNNNDIPVTGGPDVLYSETVVEETPVDDNWSYFNNRFQSDYSARYGSSGQDYSYYQPAYRFGYDLASDPQYSGWQWGQVEPVARQRWQAQGMQGTWEDFRDFVYDAWDRVTNG